VLFLRTNHTRRESMEHERHIINAHRLEEKIDGMSAITIDPKTKKPIVVIKGKTYTLKEDV